MEKKRKLLSLILVIAMVAALLPTGLTVTAVTPGSITNLVTKYTGSPTNYAATGAANASLYVVQGSSGIPAVKYDSSTGYATDQARIDAALANNPYFTSDKTTWVYGDRDPDKVFSGADVYNPVFSQTQYVQLNTTASKLLGPNVTKILALNGEKNFTTAIPDLYSFDIDKPATVYVNTIGAYDSVFVNTYNWTKDTTVSMAKSSTSTITDTNGKYYSVPNGGSNFGTFYSKHFSEAGTVNIPSRGTSGNNGYIIYVVWDADGSGDTTLSTLSYNDGTDHNITVVPGQTTYNVKANEGTAPIVNVTLTDPASELTVTQATSVPGTATINVASGIYTQTYTINFSVAGFDTIYVDRSNTTGTSGMTVAKNMGSYPTTPPYAEISNSQPNKSLNEANATGKLPLWDFNDTKGTVNYSRTYTNFGSQTTSMRNQNYGGGSSNSAYIKMDLKTLDRSRSVQQAILTASFTGGGATYAGTNKKLYVEVYEVPETNWITGTGSGEIYWSGSSPDKAFTLSSNFKLFPLVNSNNEILPGTGNVSEPYPLTWAAAPDNTGSLIPEIKAAATAPNAVKKLTTVYVGDMNSNTNTIIGTVGIDVTQSVIDKLTAGAKTASFMLKIAPYIYGWGVPGQNDMTSGIYYSSTVTTDRPKLEVTSTVSGSYASGNNNLIYITVGDKSYYSSGNRTYQPGHTPIDLGGGFDPAVTTEQTFNVATADLTNGKVSVNAFAQDALATVSINGAAATAGFQSAAITPSRGSATAQVVVTAPNGDQKTYNLKFVISDYVLSTDSTLKALTYTHPSLGTKEITLSSGVTEYNVELPYDATAELPQIAGEPNHAYATIQSITQIASMPGSATMVVKAESGATTTYKVNFTKSNVPPVVDHLPGNVANVKTRYQNSTTAYPAPTAVSNVYSVQGSNAVPVTKYDASTGYDTMAKRVDATMSTALNPRGDYPPNPYYTTDTKAWTFGDRPILDPDTATGAANSVFRGNTQFVMVDTTSPFLLGDNVTKILTRNDSKSFTLTIPDLYTFSIDKAATIYVGCESTGAAMDTNFVTNNGWKKDIGTKINRASVPYPNVQGDDGLYYAIPNGATNSAVVYSKHYVGGANVAIPSSGMTTAGGVVVFVVWDGANTNTTLSNISLNGETIQGFAAGTTTYDVVLPSGTTQVPALTATAAFSGASVQITNAASLPGTATIHIVAADGVTTGDYTINYTVEVPKPDVTADDILNIINGLNIETMEYAVSTNNGQTYGDYTSAEPQPFGGNLKVKVKFKGESAEVILNFTTNYGDVDANGVIIISDVIMAAEIAVGNDGYTSDQKKRANVSDKQDMTVDISDVVMIAERAVGSTTTFPIDKP